MDKFSNRLLGQILFLIALLMVGFVIFDQLRFFLGSFLGALVLYVVVRKLYFRIIDSHKKLKQWMVSLTFVLTITVIMLGLGFLVFEVTAQQFPNVDTSKIAGQFNGLTGQINEVFGFTVLSNNIIGESSTVISKALQSVLNTTYSFAINVFLMLIILFFMLLNAHAMECKVLLYQPFRGKSLDMVRDEIYNMIFSNAIGIPLIMLSQGVVAWLVYTAFGIENAVFWAFLTAFCGLIPMIGTALVSVPLGISLMVDGGVWQGVVLIICGLFLVANVDNLTRMILLKKRANTHPLVVIFGVLLGIPFFGFWGIIFGPLLISCFLLLVKIYYHQYGLLNDEDENKCAAIADGKDIGAGIELSGKEKE